MKRVFFSFTVLVILCISYTLTSCSCKQATYVKPKHKFTLIVVNNDKFMDASASSVQCDSFIMPDIKHATIYVDGNKSTIVAQTFIEPQTNN